MVSDPDLLQVENLKKKKGGWGGGQYLGPKIMFLTSCLRSYITFGLNSQESSLVIFQG